MALENCNIRPNLNVTCIKYKLNNFRVYIFIFHVELQLLREINTDYPYVRVLAKSSKAVPLHAMVAPGGRGGIALLILDLGTRWG
jgi:hypothetical protein